MDGETITLTMKEMRRLQTIEAALAGRITNSEGARRLGLSERQFKRLRKRVVTEGPQGAIHKARGTRSNRRLPDGERERIRALLENTYAGFNDTHAHELLVERHGVTCSRQTLRTIRREAGLAPTRRRRAPKHRARRERRGRAGAMLLMDGSTHDWFEGRGGRCTLLGVIDDATSEVLALSFEASEDLAGYLDLFAGVLKGHGVPTSTYSDSGAVFFVNSPTLTIEQQLEGEVPLSQFGRALDELGVEMIRSLSPQSRGRVERLWGTLQDRLVSEMRLEGISTREQANAFLASFLPRFNARFASAAAESETEWLKAPADLDWFLCAKYRRTVGNDNTVRLGERTIDVPAGPRRSTWAKAKVEVHELTDGRARVVRDGQVIAQQDPQAGFDRLRPRTNKGLTEAGQLPVATLTRRRCTGCKGGQDELRPAG